MGNQQPRGLQKLCINAKLGDGYYWKHPECRNSKLIYTSTTPALLQVKYEICPEIFATGVKPFNGVDKSDARFPNGKPMYRLASLVHPYITEYRDKTRIDALREADIEDIALWYLDDGTFSRREYVSHRTGERTDAYRIIMSIGDLCDTPEHQEEFVSILADKFGTSTVGYVSYNSKPYSERNKNWHPTKPVRDLIIDAARKWRYAIPHKFPQV